jgi:hypothetical protein
MKLSVLTKKPLYSSPHLSFTKTGLPVSSCINGFGFTGLTYGHQSNVSRVKTMRNAWLLTDIVVETRHACESSPHSVEDFKWQRQSFSITSHPRNYVWPWRWFRRCPTGWRRSVIAQGNSSQNDHRCAHLRRVWSHFFPRLLAGYWWTDLLPSDVTCAKETRDLIIECCVGQFSIVRCVFIIDFALVSFSRVYTLNIIWGQWDMWSGVQKNDCTRAYYRSP